MQCRYIAKTLCHEDDEEITSDDKKKNVEPPKVLGLNPGSNEKVSLNFSTYGGYQIFYVFCGLF